MSNFMLEGQMAPKIEEKVDVVDESNQGMLASMHEGEKKVYTGPDGNPTGELTASEYKEYLESYNK